MVSAETLLSYPYWKINFKVHTDAPDKKLGAIMRHNNKPIEFFSIILRKSQDNYTKTDKEPIVIVECLKNLRRIIFGYEINVFQTIKIWSMLQP